MLFDQIAAWWPEVGEDTGRTLRRAQRQGRPTLKTQERARLYRELKKKHPTWSQQRVAMEANLAEAVDHHTVDSVRNAYRSMGWKWERADRVR